jgi:UPF0755 protein
MNFFILRMLSLIIAVLLLGTLSVGWYVWYTPVVVAEPGVRYLLKPGTSVNTFANDLSAQQVIKTPFFFKLLIRLQGNTDKLKAGEYLFPKGATAASIIKQVVLAKGLVQHSFTIIAGWSFTQLKTALLQENKLSHQLVPLSDEAVMQQINGQLVKPEGWFYPDTYYFTESSSDIELLKRAYQLMAEKLNIEWQNRETDSPFQNAYEALIAASLVEKEAYLNAERPIIAGVLINRLKKNMLLQFDPTVIYGLGDTYTGAIQKTDLIADNPYNTYRHKGLPPTPIAMPSLASIVAVLHPAHHDHLYFVAKGDGSHQFSANLEDHNKAVTQSRILEANKVMGRYFNENVVKKYLENTSVFVIAAPELVAPTLLLVIPAKAGIHLDQVSSRMDPRLRGNDKQKSKLSN